MVRRIATLVLTLVLAAAGSAAAPAAAEDRVALSGLDLFDADEGTVECWVKFAFEPLAEDDAAHRGWGTLFHLHFGDPTFPGDGLRVSLHSVAVGDRTRTGRQLRLRAMIHSGDEDVMHPTVTGFGQDVTRNQWYHLAVTWSAKRREVRVYIDGEHQSTRGFHSHRDYRPNLTQQARLSLGSLLARPAVPRRFAIDQVRVSSTARPAEQLGYHQGPLEPDARTLLLMSFDAAPAQSDTLPITYAASLATRDIELPLPSFARLIEGRFGGRALAFTSEPFDPQDNE